MKLVRDIPSLITSIGWEVRLSPAGSGMDEVPYGSGSASVAQTCPENEPRRSVALTLQRWSGDGLSGKACTAFSTAA